MASFYVENFGCRATQADGAAIEQQFGERGLARAQSPSQAEVVVLNTCTVTTAADQDARAAIRRIHRENPTCQIVVTGCYAQRAPEEIAALPGVTRVIGNSHKHVLAEIALRVRDGRLENAEPPSMHRPTAQSVESFVSLSSLVPDDRRLATDDRVLVSDIFAHTELLAAPVFDAANERTRPNLKVQDGCDNRCSFCVIPYVRGQSRSLPLDQVLREVDALVDAGYREVVLSGINLGRWGRDLPSAAKADISLTPDGTTEVVPSPAVAPDGSLRLRSGQASEVVPFAKLGQRPATRDQRPRFEDLIGAILKQTSLEKLRISSVEPMDWSDELIWLMAESPRIAKHAHVPMQSGSDHMLRRMHRKYRPWHYREKIEKIRAAMPTAAIGADVMTGFPGEGDAEFEETRGMVEALPFTYLHVFTYSARPGTPAAALPDQVPVQVARSRNRILRELASERKLAFMRSFAGKTVEAITLNVFDGEYTEALTDNYLKLRLAGRHEPNHWVTASVQRVVGGALLGVGS